MGIVYRESDFSIAIMANLRSNPTLDISQQSDYFNVGFNQIIVNRSKSYFRKMTY